MTHTSCQNPEMRWRATQRRIRFVCRPEAGVKMSRSSLIESWNLNFNGIKRRENSNYCCSEARSSTRSSVFQMG